MQLFRELSFSILKKNVSKFTALLEATKSPYRVFNIRIFTIYVTILKLSFNLMKPKQIGDVKDNFGNVLEINKE